MPKAPDATQQQAKRDAARTINMLRTINQIAMTISTPDHVRCTQTKENGKPCRAYATQPHQITGKPSCAEHALEKPTKQRKEKA